MPSVLEELNEPTTTTSTTIPNQTTTTCTNQITHSIYTPLVDSSNIQVIPPSPSSKPLKNFTDIKQLLQQGRKQDVKQILRNNSWPVNSPIRGELWQLLCKQHQNAKTATILDDNNDGFYWDMVNQVFGSMDLPDKPISLPPFVEPSHCQSYYMTHKGRNVTDRVVSVLGFACPDIVYSPTIYPICAILLHYMSGKWIYVFVQFFIYLL